MLGIASPETAHKLNEFLAIIGHKEMKPRVPFEKKMMKDHVAAFKIILDSLTLEQGKKIWIEKTPRHLHYIKYIEKFIPKAKFIHIIRKGPHVIASLYEVTHKFPEEWGGERAIDNCIDRWINDIKISRNYLSNKNHIFVKYEELIKNTELVVKHICNYLRINFESDMLTKYKEESEDLIQENEIWKSNVICNIKKRNSRKFHTIFNDEQRAYINTKVKGISVQDFTIEYQLQIRKKHVL